MSAGKRYFTNIYQAIASTLIGMKVTGKNAFTKPVTEMYPEVMPPIAERFRGILHNRIEDCTGCSACVRACPISCIHIQTVKRAKENVGQASDGTPLKLWVIQYDVNNSECMVCGLCTEPCPTHCLTMSHDFELAVPERKGMWRYFATEADKQAAERDAESAAKEKAAKAAAAQAATEAEVKEEGTATRVQGQTSPPASSDQAKKTGGDEGAGGKIE
ncbi:MAG: 4Fe-4S dicluster domain-containing protein [Candidatus Eisenbacteria bacterium]|uniref:4Fe-4S dicluster domain-containing protein n=1 Tax=Eiseniibacteriota bacterium TaxID=2212470 RepID=A0A948RRB5_UNCEI|nr:4Fe-4S dicluster domain-containing protein [Candidatus Eisenbacteria bacterium]MBU1949245.1 4Fe-4S dicluster domain-containing protein [Candidatus Eisenbacteria bacterium]MBU2689583.1 4Fe-4S dicluster domain-containing protein [Candidatus Eisenbacteria bacterium]